jgi:hypothetical protein
MTLELCQLCKGKRTANRIIGRKLKALEIAALKERLSEAEDLLQRIKSILLSGRVYMVDLKVHHGQGWSKMTNELWDTNYDESDSMDREINTFLNPPNPADDPNHCLACMGATGSAVRHTCKPK